jgi:hypothetical protein
MSGKISRAFDAYFDDVAFVFPVELEKGLARGSDSVCSPILGGM